MIVAKYDKDREYDSLLSHIVNLIRKTIENKKDDFMLMCVGPRGTGKSSLMLHAYEDYDSEDCHVKYIGLNPKDFSQAMYRAKKKDLPRFCGNDEANLSKRDHSTKWNKDVLDMYYSIRGLQIFHWWNNPSLDIIDKPFIEELIKGFIYIATKDKDRPRIYYYFRQQDILRLYEDQGDLKLKTIHRHAKKYAYYKGWFKAYKGKLWEAYQDKKEDRMEEKINQFYLKYGVELYSYREAGTKLGYTHPYISKHVKVMVKKDMLTAGEDYVPKGSSYKLTPDGLEKLRDYLYEKNS